MNKRRVFSDKDDGMTSQSDDRSEQKKSRLEDYSEPTPSCVVHIRNVPVTATEEDIAILAVPFGRVSKMIYARRNNQALMEMENIIAAGNLVVHYRAQPPVILGRTCIVQFSRHAFLDTKNDNTLVERAIEQANYLSQRDSNTSSMADFIAQKSTSGVVGADVGFHSVLHVLLENNSNEPINHLLLYKVFSQFGRVLRIVMFTKVKTEHALIEFDSPVCALTAKVALDNRALLGGRYPMRIEFSKLSHLEIRNENEKSRDFDRSPLTEMERYAVNALSLVTDLVVDGTVAVNTALAAYMLNPSSHLGSASSSSTASFATRGLGGTFSDLTQRLGVTGNLLGSVAKPLGNPVVIVSNLNENKVEPGSLFTLFGVYGDVMRVKILFNKKDTALIQFSDSSQAITAKENLNNLVLWGQAIKVNMSRHQSIQLPRDDTDGGLTRDYSTSHLHRFRNPLSKNMKNIYPPNATLHVSNLLCECSEDDLVNMFQRAGYSVLNIRFLQKEDSKRKMALVQLPSVDDAVLALIKFHDYEFRGLRMRVTFSSRIHK